MIQSRLRCSSKIRKAIAVHPFDADGVYPQSAGPSTAFSGGASATIPTDLGTYNHTRPCKAKRPFLLSTPTVHPRCTSRYTPRAPEREGENCRPEHGVLGGLRSRSPWAPQATSLTPKVLSFLFFRALNFCSNTLMMPLLNALVITSRLTPKVP